MMLVLAIMIDAIQGLLMIFGIGIILNSFIFGATYLLFALWFYFGHGIKMVRLKKGERTGLRFALALIDFVPILNSLPAITTMVAMTIWQDSIKEAGETPTDPASAPAQTTKQGSPQPKTSARPLVNT